MAAEPIRELILQDCESSLGAIDGTGAYHHALVSVERGKPAVPEDLKALPAAFIQEGEEMNVQDINLLVSRRLSITVEMWVRSDQDDLPTLTNRALGDLELALMADLTRGGQAIDTEVTGRTVELDERPGVLGTARLQCAIDFQTLKKNPASKG